MSRWHKNFEDLIQWIPLSSGRQKNYIPWWMYKFMANTMSKNSTPNSFASRWIMQVYFVDVFCTYWFIRMPRCLLLYWPHCITYDDETLPVPIPLSSQTTRRNKWIAYIDSFIKLRSNIVIACKGHCIAYFQSSHLLSIINQKGRWHPEFYPFGATLCSMQNKTEFSGLQIMVRIFVR